MPAGIDLPARLGASRQRIGIGHGLDARGRQRARVVRCIGSGAADENIVGSTAGNRVVTATAVDKVLAACCVVAEIFARRAARHPGFKQEPADRIAGSK